MTILDPFFKVSISWSHMNYFLGHLLAIFDDVLLLWLQTWSNGIEVYIYFMPKEHLVLNQIPIADLMRFNNQSSNRVFK